MTVEDQPYVAEVIEFDDIEENNPMFLQRTSQREHAICSARGIVLVYNICERASFMHIRRFHEQVRNARKDDMCPILLLGNMKDYGDSEREVDTLEGEILAALPSLGMLFAEVSAKTGENVDQAFFGLLREIHRRGKIQKSDIPAQKKMNMLNTADEMRKNDELGWMKRVFRRK